MSSRISHAMSHHAATRWRLGYDEAGYIFMKNTVLLATSGMLEYTGDALVYEKDISFVFGAQYFSRMPTERDRKKRLTII